jgi:hypothetical protein
LIDLIKERNRLDEQLYATVAKRFQALVDADPGFVAELERFRKRNSRYQPWGHLTYTYPRRLREAVSRSRSGS